MSSSQTPYMVGRLLGANEMASIMLDQDGESENARHIGRVLGSVATYFFEEVERPTERIVIPEKRG